MKENNDLKKKLSPLAYEVTQKGVTEPAGTGKYLHEKSDGMYHCAVCDSPLFSSETKFDSGSGWPSFHSAYDQGAVKLEEDTSHNMNRTEVKCGKCGAHLGHVFDDAPQTPSGKRFCINSCSLDLKDNTKNND